jgi:hypothetical protein
VYETLIRTFMVEISNDDITSGSGRLLSPEIDMPPLETNEKPQINCERYAIHEKRVLDTDRKPRLIYRLVMSLPVSDAS